MAFHEVRFPDAISRGAVGGPMRKTRLVELESGDEERNASWADSRHKYNAAYGIRGIDDLAIVTAFFEARNGMLYGFRWKDWADYKSCLPTGVPANTDQQIGVGDGVITDFQLIKDYTSGGITYQRCIKKPVSSTVLVALDGIDQPSGWTIDTTTGIVSFVSAPDITAVITAGFQFDVPVRFDTDYLPITQKIERLGAITSIPLIEVRR